MVYRRCWIVLLLGLGCVLPAAAQGAPPSAGGSEPGTWGFRVGVADDPDQGVFGVHINLGEAIPHWDFRPNIELGLGDDHTMAVVTAPLHFRFKVNTGFTPYAGGGLAAGFVDRDLPGGRDDTDFEVAVKAIGGLEWRTRRGSQIFVELNLVFGDLHDTQLMFGWVF